MAPTDPVLAADSAAAPPGTGEEGKFKFGLTWEAGLNDGVAFPFVVLGLLTATSAKVCTTASRGSSDDTNVPRSGLAADPADAGPIP